MGFSLTEASQAGGEIKVGAAFSAEAVLVFSDQGHSHATGLENCPLGEGDHSSERLSGGMDISTK